MNVVIGLKIDDITVSVMPQLDKYIFFNHVVSLTIFFALIYVFIRKSVVPEISTTLKYRKKRLILFNSQIAGYDKLLNYSKTIFDKKGKIFVDKLLENVIKISSFYNKESLKQLSTIYNKNFSVVKNNNEIADFIIKNKREVKRLNKTVS